MTTDHSWNRPAPTAVDAGARFLSQDDLTVQVSTGVAAVAAVDGSGWVQDLTSGLAADRCGLTPGTISAQSLNLSDYSLGNLTLVALIKPSGTLSGGAVGCVGAIGDERFLILPHPKVQRHRYRGLRRRGFGRDDNRDERFQRGVYNASRRRRRGGGWQHLASERRWGRDCGRSDGRGLRHPVHH